jgi:hypothetical protein
MFSRLFGGFFRVLRPVMSFYLLVVTTIAVPFTLNAPASIRSACR